MRLLTAVSLLLIGLGPAPASAAPPPPVPVETLAELPYISDPVLSPDGKRILANINAGGTERVAVYDLTVDRKLPPTIIPPRGTTRWFAWAGNDRVVFGHASVALFLGAVPVPITRLSRYELADGNLLPLGKGNGFLGDDVIFIDPHGRYLLLSAQDKADQSPSVSRIDLATGAAVEVQPRKRGIWTWMADAGGIVRGGVVESEKGWDVYQSDPRTGEVRKITRRKITNGDGSVDSIRLMPGSGAGIIITNEPTGRFGVYRYDLATGAVGPAIFEHPQVDVTGAQVSDDGTRVEGVFYEDERPRVAWLDPDLKRVQEQIDGLFKNKVNRILNWSRDRQRVLLLSTSANDPGIYYVFDRRARRMEAFAAPYEKLVDRRLPEMTPVRYTARDGLSIPAYLTLPVGREPKGLPLILMPHGGPFARDSYRFDPWVQLLASRGYAVLQPNFRGSTGYGREFVERGHGQWGAAMQDDLDDGVQWLARQGTIDPRRICIMGASYGGYAALWGAIRNPELYRCAISMAGVTDLRGMLKYDSKHLVTGRYAKQWRRKVEGEERRDLAQFSPLQQAARLRVPTLIAHGELDANVPVEQGTKMVAALRARGAPVHAAFYPLSGHSFSRTEDSLDFMRRVEAFLEVHNPAEQPGGSGARSPELVGGRVVAGDLNQRWRKKASAREVVVRIGVTADGRASACQATSSSGVADLDAQVCKLAQERFQYRPARSAAGQLQDSSATYAVALTPVAGG